MITYLYANNYLSLVNFKVSFDKVNLLLGKNGTGKSNILFLLARLSSFIKGIGKTDSIFPTTSLTRWLKSDIQTFEFGMNYKELSYVYHLEVEHNKDLRQCKVLKEEVTCNEKRLLSASFGHCLIYDESTQESKELLADQTMSCVFLTPPDKDHVCLQLFITLINGLITCSPEPRHMLDVVENDVYVPSVDFSNIGSVYMGIGELNPDIHAEMRDAMKQIDGSFVRAKSFLEGYRKYLAVDRKYNDVESTFHFSELSDGEKMLFALYMILYAYIKKGHIVLLDEPDNYVSLREIQPWLSCVENEVGENGQCIMVSHNAEVINYMAASNGIWISRNASGESRVIEDPYKNDRDLFTYAELMARGTDDEA